MSRELYDLCRRYKHYWKKVEDVKQLNNKYHDLDLASALSHSMGQLCETEDEMLKQLFRDYGVMCDSIECSTDVIEPCRRFGEFLGRPIPVSNNATCHIRDSGRFIKCLSDYMYDRRMGK